MNRSGTLLSMADIDGHRELAEQIKHLVIAEYHATTISRFRGLAVSQSSAGSVGSLNSCLHSMYTNPAKTVSAGQAITSADKTYHIELVVLWR